MSTSLDRFVMSQDEVIKACQNHLSTRDAADERIEAMRETRRRMMLAFVQILAWGDKHKVPFVSISPRTRDAFVAVVAPDEDENGQLHDSMYDMEREFVLQGQLTLRWMLFRQSERAGVDAFVDPAHQLVLIGE